MTPEALGFHDHDMTWEYFPHYWPFARKSLQESLSNGSVMWHFNTLRPRQNGRHFPDDIFKWIFLNENVWISINISLKFVPRGPINNIPTLVQVMAWRRPGDKQLSEPMMVRLPTHICVTRPQWVNAMTIAFTTRMWNMISSPATPTVRLEQKSENFQSRNVTISKLIVFEIICYVAYHS